MSVEHVLHCAASDGEDWPLPAEAASNLHSKQCSLLGFFAPANTAGTTRLFGSQHSSTTFSGAGHARQAAGKPGQNPLGGPTTSPHTALGFASSCVRSR